MTSDYLLLTNNPGLLSVHIQIHNNGPDFSYFTKVNVSSGSLTRSHVCEKKIFNSETLVNT